MVAVAAGATAQGRTLSLSPADGGRPCGVRLARNAGSRSLLVSGGFDLDSEHAFGSSSVVAYRADLSSPLPPPPLSSPLVCVCVRARPVLNLKNSFPFLFTPLRPQTSTSHTLPPSAFPPPSIPHLFLPTIPSAHPFPPTRMRVHASSARAAPTRRARPITQRHPGSNRPAAAPCLSDQAQGGLSSPSLPRTHIRAECS
jgi:hypothetical protein